MVSKKTKGKFSRFMRSKHAPVDIICIPDNSGNIDAQWLKKLASTEARIYSTPRIAKSLGLHSTSNVRLNQDNWLQKASQKFEHPTVIIRSGLEVPPLFFERIQLLIESQSELSSIIAFLGNYSPDLNPLSEMTAALQPKMIDRLFWNMGAGQNPTLPPLLEHSVRAAFVNPNAQRGKNQEKNIVSLTDLFYIHDPKKPLCSESPKTSAIQQMFGSIRAQLQDMAKSELEETPYYGLDGKPVTLHVTHDWGGGIQRWVEDIHCHDQEGHHLVLASRSNIGTKQYGEGLDLFAGGAKKIRIQSIMLDPPINSTAVRHAAYADQLSWIINRFGVGRVIVSSLIGQSLDCLSQDIPTAQVLHDFYPASPMLDIDPMNYVDEKGQFMLSAMLSDGERDLRFLEKSPSFWRKLRNRWKNVTKKNQVQLIAPSKHVASRWQSLFANELPAISVLGHGFTCPQSWKQKQGVANNKKKRLSKDRRPNLVVIGRLSRGKGFSRLAKVASALRGEFRFTIVGGGAMSMHFFSAPNVDVILDYDLTNLPTIIQRIQPAAALFLSEVPETWNYVLSEVRFLELPVIAPDIGSFRERVTHGNNGLLYSSDTQSLITLLRKIKNKDIKYPKNFKGSREPSMRQALSAYNTLVKTRQRKPTLILPPRPAFQKLQQLYEELRNEKAHKTEVLTQTSLMHKTIKEQEQSLRQLNEDIKIRTNWGLKLDTELKEKSDWALELDKELSERTEWAFRLDGELNEKNAWIDQLQHSLAHVTDQASNERQIKERLELRVNSLADQVQVVTQQLGASEELIENTRQQLTDKEKQYRELQNKMGIILNSRSWKLTKPIRSLFAVIRFLRYRRSWHPSNWIPHSARFFRAVKLHGLRNTFAALQHAPIPKEVSHDEILEEIGQHPETVSFEPIKFPAACPANADVCVSIIIPVYNKLNYTVHCLQSLLQHTDDVNFEIIIVNDCSTDSTSEYLQKCEGLKLVNNPRNLGFIESCNHGASTAKGHFLVFLNNDTAVTKHWLSALLDPFRHHLTGIVGARLIYPTGELQEAGGIVFNDGSGWNYGRLGSKDSSRVSFVCEADYVSGACLAIKAEIFHQLGGFDCHYKPAYYEDTDLCFKVRDLGLKVIYQPACVIIHFEGISSGTSESTGIKKYQAVNREKFARRWSGALQTQPDPVPGPHAISLIEKARHHRTTGHILVIDAETPQPDHDSGSVRMMAILQLLLELGYRVSFMPVNLAWKGAYSEALQNSGIEVIRHPEVSNVEHWLENYGDLLSWVFASRHYVLSEVYDCLTKHCPQAKIIFDTVDLHFLREQRQAELACDAAAYKVANATRSQELSLIQKADVTTVVSITEKDLLLDIMPDASIQILSNIHCNVSSVNPPSKRTGLLFMGGYQHPPNVDAADWLIGEILPMIQQRDPEIELHLIGSRMPHWLQAAQRPGLRNHGFVEDVTPYLQTCKVSVAPLRYGAGVKGKVNQAMSHGLPVVASSCAAEGMFLNNEHDVLIADDTDTFVEQILRLYYDDSLWLRLSQHGQENIDQHFSRQAAKESLRNILH